MIHLRTVEGILFANERVLKYIGVGWEELQGQGWLKYIHPEDQERTLAIHARSTVEIATMDQIYRLRGADGHNRWFRSRSEPYPNEDGNSYCWYGVTTDIDELYRSRELVREQELQLDLLTENVPAVLVKAALDAHAARLLKTSVADVDRLLKAGK